MVSRNEKEKVMIEGSINSVRVSIAIKQVSDIEEISYHIVSAGRWDWEDIVQEIHEVHDAESWTLLHIEKETSWGK